jgi:hypothetical protein
MMATATKKNLLASPSSKSSQVRAQRPSSLDRIARGLDAIYRFLASLKLAVFTLALLVGTLAYATFVESWSGGAAAQEWIYRSPGFAVLLAFLAMNILCAALIRFPWKKRQTGFVITHAGLLTLLAGSYSCVKTADEGQLGMLEGDVKNELVRTNHPVIRIREIDPHTRNHTSELDLPFQPGSFAWGPGQPQPRGLANRALTLVSLGLLGSTDSTEEILTRSGDPFQFVVKEFFPASAPAIAHVPDDDGAPLARLELKFKGPGMPKAQDGFRSEEDHWFATERKFYRVVRSQRPAVIAFSYVDRPELVDDFLKPPQGGGSSGVARFRYQDQSGRSRVFDWPLEGQKGKSVVLPDSDLSVVLSEATEFPTSTGRLDQVLGEDPIPIGVFKIQSGKAEPVTHMALANLPMVPNVIPPADESGKSPPRALASIHYMVVPTIDPKTNGRFGQIEVLAGPDSSLHYRVFGRGKESLGELRASGSVEKGKPIVAFGGGANMPMTISFQVDRYLPSAIEKQIYEPVVLPKGKADEGIAACRAEMTVGNQTKEVWLARSLGLDPPAPRVVSFGDVTYEVMYDVDRKPLDFELKLDDFDVGFEPGTEQATKFVSQVELTDPSLGIKNQPYTISMNHPLYHRGYTFYQSRYMPEIDPHSNQTTGRFESVFQVAINPARPVIYAGCLMVVLGAFVQFYMRAGIFTDGGKRERERDAAKARKRLAKAQKDPAPSPGDELI